jgi:hypothetical protein
MMLFKHTSGDVSATIQSELQVFYRLKNVVFEMINVLKDMLFSETY